MYAALRRPPSSPPAAAADQVDADRLSWAIEDECCARAERPIIFGGFQKERYFRAAEERWNELARISRSTIVFADFDAPLESTGGSPFVHLPEDCGDAPGVDGRLRRARLPRATDGVGAARAVRRTDRKRLFEAIWTVEPAVVRDGARTCAQVALQLGHEDAAPLLYELAENPPPPPLELQNATSLLNRVVAYVDSLHRR